MVNTENRHASFQGDNGRSDNHEWLVKTRDNSDRGWATLELLVGHRWGDHVAIVWETDMSNNDERNADIRESLHKLIDGLQQGLDMFTAAEEEYDRGRLKNEEEDFNAESGPISTG